MTRLAMGLAMTMALSLALVFTLLLVLLADLFCSLLCCRKHRIETAAPNTSNAAAAAAAAKEEGEEKDRRTPPVSKPLSFPFYAHGVLQAPTTFLLTIPKLEAAAAAFPPSQAECRSPTPLIVEHEHEHEHEHESLPLEAASPCVHRISSCASVSSAPADRFLYISNPIYGGFGGGGDDDGTPFETPDASPSRLGLGEEEETAESDYSPQLTVMRKLSSVAPRALSAVALMDGRRSLATSASGATETYNKVSSSSSSSSNSLCCSPSW